MKNLPKNKGWEICSGGNVVRYGIPGIFVAGLKNFYMLRWKYIRTYLPDENRWLKYPGQAKLPGIITKSASATSDNNGSIYLFTGGSNNHFCRYRIETNNVEKLQTPPKPVGRGSAMVYTTGKIYAFRGGISKDFWEYDPEKKKWSIMPGFGKPEGAPLVGKYTGLLSTCNHFIYGWADHHTKVFDKRKNQWADYKVLDFRPSWDGGMVVSDKESKKIYFVQGGGTQTWGVLDLAEKEFFYLLPRLPDTVSVPGNRLIIKKINDKIYAYVYKGSDSNELWRIKISDLQLIKS